MKKTDLLIAVLVLALAGCGAPRPEIPPSQKEPVAKEKGAKKGAEGKIEDSGGGYYLDDGPADISPEALAAVPDAVPKPEKIIAATARPYTALGKRYTPHRRVRAHRERGEASWYGKRYHGRKTASGETYDMFRMTAAHPVLPIPSYARVTRPDTGKSVVVRINDRGPFLGGRVIDLSFAAAHRLDIVKSGTGEVVVEAIIFPAAGGELPEPEYAPPEGAPEKVFTAEKTYIQLGAFAVPENAQNRRREFIAAFADIPHKIHFRDGLHLLLAGPYSGEAAARGDDGVLCAAGWCGFLTRAP